MTGVVSMKALVKNSIHKYDLKLVELPLPVLQPGEVLVKVIASSICGSDLHMFLGHSGYNWIDYPIVLGHEVVGVVEKSGDGDETLKGRRVVINPYIPCGQCDNCLNREENICEAGRRTLTAPPLSLQFGFRRNGGMAEYMVVPRENALPIGERVTDAVAAMLESMAVGVHAVNKARSVAGKTVLIYGPGPIGLGIAAICKGLGAGETIVAGLAEDQVRLEIARSLGALPVMIAPGDSAALHEKLADRPADLVFDCSGHPFVPPMAVNLLKKGGEIILVGISTEKTTLPLDCMVRGEIGVKGTYGTSKDSFLQAIEYAGRPEFCFSHIVTDGFRLEEANAAFELAGSKKGAKILLYP